MAIFAEIIDNEYINEKLSSSKAILWALLPHCALTGKRTR